MRLSTLLAYGFLPILVSVSAKGGGGDNDNDDASNLDASSATPSATTSASSSLSSAGFSGSLTGLTGDSQCTSLMCISAVVNGSTVEYVLQSTGSHALGWMAMGFGSQMANSPMVIMWPNSDGSVTLSQRQASGEIMPTVVSSPPRVATAVPSLTSTSGSNPKFGYSIPANSDTSQSIIWAFGSTNPGDASTSATLQIHDSSGTLTLDLTKSLTSGSSSTDPATGNSGSSSSSSSTPLLLFQKLVIAHAVVLGIAFLILLPAGALLARWLRTFSPIWFLGHWIIQLYLAGPLVVVGIGLGIGAVSKAGAQHLNDDHKRWGIAIFVLYLAQCALGGIIHFVKPRPKFDYATGVPLARTRPPQNYGHAVLGLLVVALSFYQVRTGYRDEWPRTTGRGNAPKGVNIAWTVWVVLLPILYALGLVLIPKQYRQERGAQTGHGVAMKPMPARVQTQNLFSTASNAQGGESTTYLSPGGTERDDELSSNVHGDPDAEDVGLTPSGRRNRPSSSHSHSQRLSAIASMGRGRMQGGGGSVQMVMRECSPPGATLSSGNRGGRY